MNIRDGIVLEHEAYLVARDAWVKVAHNIAHTVVGQRVLSEVLVAIGSLAAPISVGDTARRFRIVECRIQGRLSDTRIALLFGEVILAVVDSVRDGAKFRGNNRERAKQ